MNRPRTSLALAVVIAAGLVASAPAASASGDRVLAMNVEGDHLDKAQRDALTRGLRAELAKYPGLEVQLPSSADLTDEMIELECVDIDLSCLSRLAGKYRVDRVFYGQVDRGDGPGQVLRVKAVDAGQERLLRDSRVEVAALADVAGALAAEVAAVFGPVPTAAETGTLVITTNVPGATIYLGAEVVGTGEATVTRPAGEYVVRVTRDGYEERIEKVAIVAGETTERTLALTMASVGTTKPGKPGEPRVDDDEGTDWVLWAVIGAAVLGGTIAVIAATSGGDDEPARGPVVFSIDPGNAWRDVGVQGGRQ